MSVQRLRPASELTTTAGSIERMTRRRPGNGVAEVSARNGGNANPRIQQRPQRAILVQRQHRNIDAFSGESVAKKNNVPLRATAFEGAQHDGKTRPRYVGTQHFGTQHGLRCYSALAGTSHDKRERIKYQLDIPSTFVNPNTFVNLLGFNNDA